MADLLLKKGSFDDFKLKVFDPENNVKNAVEGALYFTEDEGGLYLGKADKTVVRIQGTVHQYATLKDFTSEITPPYSKDVIYFIADKDALVRWNGKTWVQLNTTAAKAKEISDAITAHGTSIKGLTDSLNALTKTVGDNKAAIEGTVSGIDGRLTAAEGAIALKASQADLESTQADLDTLEGVVSGHGDAINNITNNYVKNETFTTTVEGINQDISDINAALGIGGTGAGTIGARIDALENDNNTNKENIATNAENIKNLQDALGTTNTTVSGIDGRLTTAEGEIDTLQQDLDKAEEDLGKLTTRVGTAEGEIDTLQGEMLTAKTDIQGLKDSVAAAATKEELNGVNTALSGEIELLKTKTDTTNTNLGNLTTRVGTAEGTIAGHTTQLSSITDTLATLATKEELSDLSDELKAEIDSDILAANAMTYKKGIGSEVELLAENPSVGDTYVVTSEFTHEIDDDKVVTYQPGDLLIATSSNTENPENDEGKINAEDLVWVHVATGYSSVHNPKLSVGDNIIVLSDFANNVLGSVKLESSSENIVITTDNANSTVNVAFQWGTF